MLNLLLRSKAETAVLGVVLFNEGLHLREISRQAGISPFEARREFLILSKAGLLVGERRGNQLIVLLNPGCPFLPELKGLYLKTDGLFAQLRHALRPFSALRFAFVYGSMASGETGEKSDLDLLLIGSADEENLAQAIFAVQRKTGREINYSVWSEPDFERKAADGGAFIRSVMSGKKVLLRGDERELVRAYQAARGPSGRSRPPQSPKAPLQGAR